MTNLLPQTNNSRDISPQQENFLTNLFENGGNVTDAALTAGYSKGSVTWLKTSLADEIITRTKNVLSMHAFKAATRLVSTIDNPLPERGDDLRFRAAELIEVAKIHAKTDKPTEKEYYGALPKSGRYQKPRKVQGLDGTT